ncbi:phytanoyl-CoA dioxygenase family protein [Maribacter sp. 2-571]|uniref:phytanoyl-CoA dioxygenase family protein n=1 Tax=Maribacter sp. 2-571 TaxID=3417569 RepID=UPI003D353A66
MISDEKQKYDSKGYLLYEGFYTNSLAQSIKEEARRVIHEEDDERKILEKSGVARSFFSPENNSDLFYRLNREKNMLRLAKELLGGEVYTHQTKINIKHALIGDVWEWHQDFIFWAKDDGMPAPNVLTAMVFLDDVTEFNGPLMIIPGSHQMGMLQETQKAASNHDKEWNEKYVNTKSYLSALSADLKYTLGQQEILGMAEKRGIVSAKGKAGSVLFFHGNLFHASPNNLSPWDRYVYLITYNRVDNQPDFPKNPRPAFLANRDFTPLEAMEMAYPVVSPEVCQPDIQYPISR